MAHGRVDTNGAGVMPAVQMSMRVGIFVPSSNITVLTVVTGDPGLQANLHPAPAELLLGIAAEAFAQLRQNVIAGMHQDHADHVLVQVPIKLDRLAEQIIHRSGRFHAGEPAPRHYHRQRLLSIGFIRLVVRQFHRIDDAVSHQNGVAKCLHRQGVLFEAGRIIEIRHRTQRHDKLVVRYVVRAQQRAVHDAHLLLREIDRLDVGDPHPGVAQHLPQRLDDIGVVHVAPGDFVEHRREKHEILLGDQHDFDVRIAAQPLFEMQRRVGAGETAAENQDAFLRGRSVHDVLFTPSGHRLRCGTSYFRRVLPAAGGSNHCSTSFGPQVFGSYS